MKPDPTLAVINEGLAIRFMDIEKRIYAFPEMGKKAEMVAIPTTSGTGSEVTPFSVVTDEKTGMKYPIADYLGLGGKSDLDKVANLIRKIDDLRNEFNIPASIKEFGVDEDEFLAKLDVLSEQAFDDQCTGGNPRYPLIREIKQMYINDSPAKSSIYRYFHRYSKEFQKVLF